MFGIIMRSWFVTVLKHNTALMLTEEHIAFIVRVRIMLRWLLM